jgi:hypothetical protein
MLADLESTVLDFNIGRASCGSRGSRGSRPTSTLNTPISEAGDITSKSRWSLTRGVFSVLHSSRVPAKKERRYNYLRRRMTRATMATIGIRDPLGTGTGR